MSDKLESWDAKEADFPNIMRSVRTAEVSIKICNIDSLRTQHPAWNFSINDDQVSPIADFTRSLSNHRPTDRTLYISHGYLLANLLVAAEHFGYGYD